MEFGTDSLPEKWQSDVECALRAIFEEFANALKLATQPWKKSGRIQKVLLGIVPSVAMSGSRETAPRSFDMLIVVNDRRLAEIATYWSLVEDRLFRERAICRSMNAHVSLHVYSLTDINQKLRQGVTFFVDFVTQGAVLYDGGCAEFAMPRPLSASAAKAEAELQFGFWYPLAASAHQLARRGLVEALDRDAAFLFHQATERAYHCLLRTLKLHSPKTHDIEMLRAMSERIAPMLSMAWPADEKFQRRCFAQLRRSYVDARYSRDFSIGELELSWIDDRVAKLLGLVKIEKQIADLPEPTRQIFQARRVQQLGYEQIAHQLGLSLSTVEQQMEKAVEAMSR